MEIYEKNFNDKSVIIIEVPYSIKKPVFIKSEGMPQGAYLRAGSNTRKANPEYIEELLRENKRIFFDEESVHVDFDVLSKDLLKTIFKKIDHQRLISEKIIGRAASRADKYYPTITGILAFCDNPDLYIPEAVIQCSRFRGVDGRDLIQTEEIRGNLERQIDLSFELIKSWLVRDYKLLGTKLKGKMLIPEVALREAIANAVIHRKYWIPGATKIALYDNRLEIFNPGNFPGLFNLNHLGDGTTYLRNSHLARIARYFGIIEKLGTGIRLILESCNKAGIKTPEYIEGSNSVKVIFHLLPDEKQFFSEEKKLLAYFDMHPEAKLSDIEKYLGVSRNTTTRKLNQLIETGKIRRQGRGAGVIYIRN